MDYKVESRQEERGGGGQKTGFCPLSFYDVRRAKEERCTDVG